MAFTLLSARSSVPGHAPNPSTLQLGQLAVNTNDGLLYFVQQNSTTLANTIVCLGPTPAVANGLTNNTVVTLTGDFTGSSLTRTSNATYFDANGNLQIVGPNVARPQYVNGVQTGYIFEGSSTNWVPNANMVGFVAGTPGTVPSSWYVETITGITQTIATGTESGIPYVDLTLSGTSNTSTTLYITSAYTPSAVNGQTWTASLYARLSGGTFANTNVVLYLTERDINEYQLGSGSYAVISNAATTLAASRYTVTHTNINSATAYEEWFFAVNLTAGQPINFTLRFGAPQLELGSTATTFIPTYGSVVTRAADIAFNSNSSTFFRNSNATYFDATNTLQTATVNVERPLFVNGVQTGYLIENAATNYIENPRAVGAVNGTIFGTGSMPTIWGANGIAFTAGVTCTVVGTGTESGIPYIEFNFAGTTTSGENETFFSLNDLAYAPTLAGQTWTFSTYARLTSGSLANVSAMFIQVQTPGSGPSTVIAPTVAALNTQRFSDTATATSSGNVGAYFGFFPTGLTGQIINFNIRIGAPQLEIGSYPTSVILPAANTVAVSYRAADTLVAGGNSATIVATLANSGVTAGTYDTLTVNSKGLITAGSVTPYQVGASFVPTIGNSTMTGTLVMNAPFIANGISGISSQALYVTGATTVNGNVSFNDPYVGDATTLNVIQNQNATYGTNITLNANSTSIRAVQFMTNSVMRWSVGTDGSAETGNSVGSNINFTPYPDNGGVWVSGTLPTTANWSSICYGNSVYVAIAGTYSSTSNVAAYSTDGVHWTASTMPSANYWYGVAYGNGTFVSVSDSSSTAAYSTNNGATWSSTSIPTANWISVCYGGGMFVAVATSGTIIGAYSTNGIAWTQSTMPSSGNWYGLSYGAGKFVALNNNGGNVAAYSTDGIHWTQTVLPTTGYWAFSTYGNGIFVAITAGTASNVLATSADGINWMQRTFPISVTWEDITFGNGLFVVTSSTSTYATSPDGIVWTIGSMPINSTSFIGFGNNAFVAVGYGTNNSAVMTAYTPVMSITRSNGTVNVTNLSTTNTTINALTLPNTLTLSGGVTGSSTFNSNYASATWIQQTMPSSQDWLGLAYGNGTFVATGGHTGNTTVAATSTNGGVTWTQQTLPANLQWFYMGFGNGLFIVTAANSNIIATSSNGVTWTQQTMPSTQYWGLPVYGNSVYVSVAEYTAAVATSSNGVTWTQHTMPSSQNWVGLAYGANVFVTLAYNTNIAATSPDGVNWTTRTMPSTSNWLSVTYGNGIFVAISNQGAAATSPDGINWTLQTLPGSGIDYQTIVFGNGVFVVSAYSSGYFGISSNGIIWTQQSNAIFQNWIGLAFGGGNFVSVAAGGTNVAGTLSPMNITTTLPNTGVSAGTWNTLVVGSNGFVTSASNTLLTSLVANTTFYVASNGSDSNAGTSTKPWLTLQNAWNTLVDQYDLNGYNATINVANGTYGPVYCNSMPVGYGVTQSGSTNSISFVGNTTNAATCVITATSSTNSFNAINGCFVNIAGFTLTSPTYNGLIADYNSVITINGPMIFGSMPTGYHIIAAHNSTISANSISYTINGNAGYAHMNANVNGIISMSNCTITLTGTPAFGTGAFGFAYASTTAAILATSCTYSGSATGQRYIASQGAIIYTGSNNANYFPGNSSGTTSTGGQYY